MTFRLRHEDGTATTFADAYELIEALWLEDDEIASAHAMRPRVQAGEGRGVDAPFVGAPAAIGASEA